MRLSTKFKPLRALILFSITSFVLFFQNCAGSFKSISTEAGVVTSSSQSTNTDPGVTPTPTPTPIPTPIDPGTNDKYAAVSGFSKAFDVGGRLYRVDTSGKLSALGGLVVPGQSDPGLTYSAFKMTDMGFNLNVKDVHRACLLTNDGRVFCFGNNFRGELGSLPAVLPFSLTPIEINLGETVKSLAQAGQSVCALLNSGIVKCWGERYDLPLVNQQVQILTAPGQIAGLTQVKEIFSNELPRQTCALLMSDDVYCWGLSGTDSSRGASWTGAPVKVLHATGIQKVAPGTDQKFCVLFDTGQVSCFKNTDANTGLIALEPIIDQVSELASNMITRCVRRTSGDVLCWGQNYMGSLGFNGKMNEIVTTPKLIPEFKNAVSLTSGLYSICAVMPDTNVKCYGYEESFISNDWERSETSLTQLGLSENVSDPSGYCHNRPDGQIGCILPVTRWDVDFIIPSATFKTTLNEFVSQPLILSDAQNPSSVQIYESLNPSTSENSFSGCYIDVNQGVKCLGDNQYGQLGNGTTTFSTTAVSVKGLSGVVKLQGDMSRFWCALTSQNRLFCWGLDPNSSAGGPSALRLTPVEQTQFGAVKDFGVYSNSLGVTQMDGTIKFPSYPDYNLSGVKTFDYTSMCGQMNDSTVSCLYGSGYTKFSNLDASTSFQFFGTCLINDKKKVQCWGDNTNGQLGQNNRQAYPGAVTVPGVANASLVFQDERGLKCAYVDENLQDQSRVLCWGAAYSSDRLSTDIFERTELRGFKPNLVNQGVVSVVSYYNKSLAQLKLTAGYRRAQGPFTIMQPK